VDWSSGSNGSPPTPLQPPFQILSLKRCN